MMVVVASLVAGCALFGGTTIEDPAPVQNGNDNGDDNGEPRPPGRTVLFMYQGSEPDLDNVASLVQHFKDTEFDAQFVENDELEMTAALDRGADVVVMHMRTGSPY